MVHRQRNLRFVESYKREAVALIRESGARLSILHDHRIAELWREYSQREYSTGWVKVYRVEVYRFVTWSNSLPGINEEILAAQEARARTFKGIPVRRHAVQAWGKTPLFGTRFG